MSLITAVILVGSTSVLPVIVMHSGLPSPSTTRSSFWVNSPRSGRSRDKAAQLTDSCDSQMSRLSRLRFAQC